MNKHSVTEEELVQDEGLLVDRCLARDRLAQKVLYETHYKSLLGTCIKYTEDQTQAEDILHDCFIKIFKKLKQFDRKSKLKSWMSRIVINAAIDQLRKKREFKSAFDEETEEIVEPEIKEYEVEGYTAQQILDLIKQLPIGYRTVLSMYSIDGMSHAEIGTQLRISEGSSRSQLARARKSLKEMMKERKEVKHGS